MTDLTFKAYNHVKAYPLVSDITSFLTSFALLKLLSEQVSSAVNFFLNFFAKFGIIVKYWQTVDNYFDVMLNNVDKKFPIITTFAVEDCTKYFRNMYNNTTKMFVDNVNAAYHSTDSIRESAEKLVDPMLKLANDYYEMFLNFFLPSISDTATEELKKYKNEYHRSVELLFLTFKRIEKLASNVSTVPTYISETYKTEREQTDNSTQAITKTTRKLSNEAYNTIKPTLNKFVNVSMSNGTVAEESIDKNVKQVKDDTKAMLSSTIDNIAKSTGVEVN